jgi:hypothetical protein
MTKIHTYSIAENDNNYHSQQKQLELFPTPVAPLPNRPKPQIVSIPGISPKDPCRYRVTVGSKAIASELDVSEASELAGLIQKDGSRSRSSFWSGEASSISRFRCFCCQRSGGSHEFDLQRSPTFSFPKYPFVNP